MNVSMYQCMISMMYRFVGDPCVYIFMYLYQCMYACPFRLSKAYFCIVGKGDIPIFEAEVSAGLGKVQKDDLVQFILHSALDSIEQKVWDSSNM